MSPECSDPIDLSIIVPSLDEADHLPALLKMLALQADVRFEIVLSDGGSTDGSLQVFEEFGRKSEIPCLLVESERGRGVQLNAGAGQARGAYFLFLHADSFFSESTALARALDCYKTAAAVQAPIVGHFRLKFSDASAELIEKLGYWEVKAALNRPGCTHGDQGFLMHRDIFHKLGSFVEDWPAFEDTFFAEKARAAGGLILFPVTLMTSARRFEVEGLTARHTLNALMMNFREIGWRSYFDNAKSIYRQQSRADAIRLKPLLSDIRYQMAQLSLCQQMALWYRTGRYVRRNAWQLLLARKVRRHLWTPETDPSLIESSLTRFDRRFDFWTNHAVGHLFTAFLTWIWFILLLFRSK